MGGKFKRCILTQPRTEWHPFGDSVLEQVAVLLQECSRESDTIYRYGGEEFVMILRDTLGDVAEVIAERIGKGVKALSFLAGNNLLQVTVSIGLAYSDRRGPEDKLSGEMLLNAADKALYEAKASGIDCLRR